MIFTYQEAVVNDMDRRMSALVYIEVTGMMYGLQMRSVDTVLKIL